ncbi:kinase-like protein [Pleurotus eryngii]|uniref:non-specific serine/threonine protein kinase n=1 Tax=Pleurotus eryngii TaxID=5323 RepID=A0A9P6DFZ1_PLEER|nr:kinase-like protein [Pleurotus eryngii]
MGSDSMLSSCIYEPEQPCSTPCLVNSPTSQYDVQFRLGTGATCHVMCAKVVVEEQPMTTEIVAIKVFHKRQLAYYALSKKARTSFAKRLARERDVLVAITESRSRYLTPLFEAFQDKHNIYFVLKPYPLSLSDLIGLMRDLGKRLTVGAIKFYASELLVAIEQLHSLNIAHRDIKPENILISSSGHLALADFGLSVHIPPDDQCPFTKQIRYDAVGTPAYCAPELWHADVSKKGYLVAASDIWMYGAVVLQMWLSKRLPFFSAEGEDRGVMFDMYQLVEYPIVADFLSSIIHAPEDLRPYIPTIKAHKFFLATNWHSVCNRFDDQKRER